MRPLFTLSPFEHGAFVAGGLLIYVLVTRIGRQRRHPSAALAWVIAIATFPYVALPLFLLFGTRKFARPLRRASVPALPEGAAGAPGGSEPRLPPAWATRLLAGLDVAPATANADAVFHADGEQALLALLALIDQARQRIDCCIYLLGDDATGRRITAALARAARRGVAVRMLIDAFGSMRTSRAERRALGRSGVQVRRFMPVLHNPLRGRTNLRNHRKLVAVDGRWLWSGGRNLAGEYFAGRAGAEPWLDLSFVVEGPIAAGAHTLFTRDWRIAGGRRSKATLPPPLLPLPPVPAGAGKPVMAQLVPSGPDRADDTVHALLLAAAWQAERRLLAVTPYFVPDEALIDAWCMACRRGVRVTLVVPRRSNHPLADWARERALRALVDAGGSVLLAPDMVHGKALVVDDRLALCGSVNLDGRSLFLNYELTTAFYGAVEIDWLGCWIERLAARSSPYAAHTPPWWRDVVEGVVRVIGFQL